MGVRGNEIDFLTMKTLRENEGYDVPWEFVRRRAARSPAGTMPSTQLDADTTVSTGVGCRGSNNENDIFQQAARPDRVIIGKRANGRFSAGDDVSVNGCKKETGSGNRESKRPPVVAPKPIVNSSNGICSVTNGSDSSSSSTSACIFNKMPGDSVNSVVINTPPCGIRAQRIRKERYASGGGCTPVGTVSASPALSRNVSGAETTDELASCVVWEYRKPEHDARPSSEYDTPWDSKRLSSGRETPSCHCPSSGQTAAIRHSTDGDAIYDEPWDMNKSNDPIKKAVIGLSFRSSHRDVDGIGGNNSPSSTSRSSDSRASAITTASNDSDRLVEGRRSIQMSQEQCPDGVSIRSTPSTVANRQDGRNGVEKKANGAARTPVHVETAFVAKPTPSTMAVLQSKKRFQDKDKLIQQLCSGDAVVSPVPRSAPRRSVNTRHSTELQNKDQRSMDERQRNNEAGEILPASDANGHRDAAVLRGPEVDNEQPVPDYETPWEFTSSPETIKIVRNLQSAQPSAPHMANAKKVEPKSKLNRQHLSLNFGCAGLNPSSAKIDTTLPLNEQMWYHGNITRAEAEQRLAKAVEGSFLVRVCESSIRQGEEYALSLKSAKGYMHMKIQQDAQRNWILGYFSQPFESIPVMIRYYSLNKLPIKGAEHMRLLRPVADQVL